MFNTVTNRVENYFWWDSELRRIILRGTSSQLMSREKAYSELSASLGQVAILAMGVRRGVSSDSDERVGSTSRSTVPQTNTDKDEMDEVVDEEENVEDVEEDEDEEVKEVEETEEEVDEVREFLSTHSVWLRNTVGTPCPLFIYCETPPVN